ncbi:MAG: NADH-quinone oxidoreductase subunit C [Rhodospirillaceae bacterium]|nr:NADH-quinone oxidoreductase subunit C [Rhodospirillaceae bacterium]|tara:strand:- start:2845 stop:3471 length:627 start_codon:yes stop_codon:yes gene_type:complete
MDQGLQDLGDYIKASLPNDIIRIQDICGELIVAVYPEKIADVLMFLRNDGNCQFKILIDICGVDYPQRNPRFEVVYNLLSLTQNQRIRIKLLVDEEISVPTATGVYSSAGWFEREAWDLYGIIFSNHDDLRRILTDYGFEGHPLRKDFPLTGHVEVRYDESQKRVVYDPVKLTQDYRTFDFLSPWEGMTADLPGDEKASDEPIEEGQS